jgi:hypothetical protein
MHKCHVFAFTAKLEVENLCVERQRLIDVADFKRNVIKTDSARSFSALSSLARRRLRSGDCSP